MLAALVVALLAIVGGTISTYLYDEDAALAGRVAAGAPLGLTALGLIAFVASYPNGLTPAVVAIACCATASPLLWLLNRERRLRVQTDLATAARELLAVVRSPTRYAIACLVFYAGFVVLLFAVFDRAMIERPDGIYTGVMNNLGDLPFHITVIARFVYGENIPPEDPTFAGAKFTYPFLADFIAAVLLRAGASLRQAMLIENLTLCVSLVGLLHRFARELVRDRLAALISPVITLLGGGLGWWLLLEDSRRTEIGIFGLLKHLPRDYSLIPNGLFRWGNSITCLLTTQRSMALGLPLAMIALTQLWRAAGEMKTGGREQGETPRSGSSMPRMIAAGIVAGVLPLAHAHSLIVVMGVAACLALLFRNARAWIAFFAIALVVALPQILWSIEATSVQASAFLEWHAGWDRGEHNAAVFWLVNTGAFIPLLLAGLFWPQPDRLKRRRRFLFWLPFALCFIVPNLVKLAPWVWDNIKVLFYWYVASAPFVALALARLWRRAGVARVAAALAVASLTLAGALDVWRVAGRADEYLEFDRDGIAFAQAVAENTAPQSLILHAPVYNHPVFLTGRRSLMGYPGHVWTHGIDYSTRESDIRAIYTGAPNRDELLERYAAGYIVVSPIEKREFQGAVTFFERFEKVVETGDYKLYKVAR